MAHEALVSLYLIIESFLNIPKCRNIFLSIPETLSVHQEVWSLKSILELDHFKESERLIALKREIVETIPKFRDLLQDHINRCLLLFPESQILYAGGGSSNELIFSQDLEKVKKEMISFADTMEKIKWKSPFVDPDEALVSLNPITKSFLDMPYFNNFHLIRETEKVQREVRQLIFILEMQKKKFQESERLNALKVETLEAITKFRDVLQDYINKCQLLFSESQRLDDESRSALIFYQVLEKVRKEMISLAKKMKKIKEEYYNAEDLKTSNKESPIADEDFDGNKALNIRGVNDEDLQQLINRVMGDSSDQFTNIISVVGMAGIGKTTIVKAIFNDPDISDYFECGAFLRIGPRYHLKDILSVLLVCLCPNDNITLGIEKSERQLKRQILKFLNDKKYLIVLDDVWDINLWFHIKSFLPDGNGSKIIFTTRLSSQPIFSESNYVHNVRFLNEKESWNLFGRKVYFPSGLEKVGKKVGIFSADDRHKH